MSRDSERSNRDDAKPSTYPRERDDGPGEREAVLRPEAQMPIDQLLRTLEVELIPRLLVAHRPDVRSLNDEASATTIPLDRNWASQAAIRGFAERCVDQRHDEIRAEIKSLLENDISIDDIYARLLAPTARYLGDGWTDDSLTFVDVSIGLCALHRLLCDCENLGFSEPPLSSEHSVLLAATPGDQHTFGISMVSDLFRRYGWQVRNLSGSDVRTVVGAFAEMQPPILGMSLHSELHYDTLCGVLREARARAGDRDLTIMVGGDFFRAHPERAAAAGADYVARDGHKAVFDARAALQRERYTA